MSTASAQAEMAVRSSRDAGQPAFVSRLYVARGVLFLLLLLAAWETASRAGLLDVRFFPPVSEVARRFVDLWARNVFPGHVLATLQRMVLGYALAAVVGIGLGLLMGYWRGLYDRLELLLELLRPLPPVALIPAFILLIGIGDEMKVALVFVGAVWPILLNTVDGVRGVHPTIIDAARMYHFGTARILRHVVFPAALPQIMAGLRTSLAISLILALVSEMIGATAGLGQFILVAQRGFRTTDMFAGIMLLAILGYALNRLFLLVERRVMAWHLERTGQAE